jgi:hypothetical protein
MSLKKVNLEGEHLLDTNWRGHEINFVAIFSCTIRFLRSHIFLAVTAKAL